MWAFTTTGAGAAIAAADLIGLTPGAGGKVRTVASTVDRALRQAAFMEACEAEVFVVLHRRPTTAGRPEAVTTAHRDSTAELSTAPAASAVPMVAAVSTADLAEGSMAAASTAVAIDKNDKKPLVLRIRYGAT